MLNLSILRNVDHVVNFRVLLGINMRSIFHDGLNSCSDQLLFLCNFD